MRPDSIRAGPPCCGSQYLPPASAAVFPSPPDSTLHICPELSHQRFCPNPPPPPRACQQGADPSDTDAQPAGTLHMFHTGNAKHPQRPAHIWEAAVPSADERWRGSACLLGRRRRARVTAWTRVYTAHIGFVYGGRAHVCLCVNPNGWQQLCGWKGSGRQAQLHRPPHNRPLRGGLCLERRGGLNVHERRGVGSGQWKTNTQTDADVLTAAEARCENKTGRAEEKLVNKPKRVRLVARLLEWSGASREVTGSSRVILV